MSIAADLLRDIDAYLSANKLPPTAFGKRVMNDGKFVSRLRGGGGVTVATVEKVRAYLNENARNTKQRRAA